jgi:hypothetical protein
MVLNGALADAYIHCNILIGLASKDEPHDLLFSRRETPDAIHGVASRA